VPSAAHPSRSLTTTCDWCRAEVPVALVEVVLLRMSDGQVEPEAWCPDCTAEAKRHNALPYWQ
jgi:hypothetical protein